MKILFLNLSALKFNVATPDTEPLGGTESCISYLARELASRRHDVTLVARLPDGFSGIAHKVKHQPIEAIRDVHFFATENFEAIVLCNAPMAAVPIKQISPQSAIILWDHVPPDQPAVQEFGNPDILGAIDCIAYVSEWQKGATEKRFGFKKENWIIGNGLTPSFENMFTSKDELLKVKENRAAYTTIPYRGLPILLKAFKELKQGTKLDIFSSMRVYQMADDQYASIYKEAEDDPRVTSHGAVPQKELARRLRPAAFLTYPCICEETYCIGALEAMAAGMKVLSTNLGALPTTTMGFADLIDVRSNRAEDLVADYKILMDKNITEFKAQPEIWAERMFEQVQRVNRECLWSARAVEWEKLLNAHKKP